MHVNPPVGGGGGDGGGQRGSGTDVVVICTYTDYYDGDGKLLYTFLEGCEMQEL